tara:strand:- start:74 stop:235 length:162 start_codon:yes stop_codon:yes gene_type:complete
MIHNVLGVFVRIYFAQKRFSITPFKILIKALESIFGPVCSWGESTCLTIAALH